MNNEENFSRSRALLGDEVMSRLSGARVIVFGVGGVGSWAVDALVRTGLCHITIVDDDRVAPSNINRQLPATVETVGEYKVEALKRHLLKINPGAQITAIAARYTVETATEFSLENYDYIIDAIDSVQCKLQLINHATSIKGTRFFSSMGAALRMDPTRVKVAEFWKVEGCPLARTLRQRFKRSGERPARKFQCVYSDEPAAVITERGSLLPVTGTFGFTLASMVLKDIVKQSVRGM